MGAMAGGSVLRHVWLRRVTVGNVHATAVMMKLQGWRCTLQATRSERAQRSTMTLSKELPGRVTIK